MIKVGMMTPPADDAALPMAPGNGRSAFDETPEQRHALYEELWEQGTLVVHQVPWRSFFARHPVISTLAILGILAAAFLR